MPTRLNDLPALSGISLLSYGANGTGKTYFAGTAGSRSYYIDIGRSKETLQSPGYRKRFGSYNPYLVQINEEYEPGNTLPIGAVAYDKLVDEINIALKIKDEWDTMVIDEATALRRISMNKALVINNNIGKSKNASTSTKLDYQIIGVQDYGTEMNLVESFVLHAVEILCKKHNKNFILVAHQRQVFAKGDKIGDIPRLVKTMPGFTGQTFPDSIPGYFDWVLYHEAIAGGPNGSVYRVRTQGDSELTAKVRHDGIFGSTISDPNFLDMLGKVKEAYNKIP